MPVLTNTAGTRAYLFCVDAEADDGHERGFASADDQDAHQGVRDNGHRHPTALHGEGGVHAARTRSRVRCVAVCSSRDELCVRVLCLTSYAMCLYAEGGKCHANEMCTGRFIWVFFVCWLVCIMKFLLSPSSALLPVLSDNARVIHVSP